MASYSAAPGNSKITQVILTSFNGNNSLNIFPQVFEMHIHESIFSGFVRAELMIHDGIGLFYNFPITGQEFVTIEIEVTDRENSSVNRNNFDRHFVIESIENVEFAENGRHMIYKMNLISRLAYENEKVLVSHAYNNTTSEAAIKIFYEYLVEPTNRVPFKDCNARFAKGLSYLKEDTNPENETNEAPQKEETDKPDSDSIRSIIQNINTERFLLRSFFEKVINFLTPVFNPYDQDIHYGADQTNDRRIWVIPNLRPIDAILWLSNFAHSKELGKEFNNYVFFETLNGFYFSSIQKLIQVKKQLADTENPYTYRSNIVNAGSSLTDERRYRTIQSLRINNRYKTLNKISSGFFENNYIQINLLEKELSSTGNLNEFYTELNSNEVREKFTIEDYLTNTTEYINKAKSHATLPQYSSDPENINRTKYGFNGFNELDGERYKFKVADHWGETVRNSSSMDEIDLTISLPGDIGLNAGDVIYCEFPQVDAYTDENKKDEFINGYFFVTESTQSFQFGFHVTTLKINKDSYDIDVDENLYKYETSTGIENS